ncbi:putative O-glycosylation ligase, exosortase A system-associated [Methylomonas methanica]|uniref:Wzy family polymerase, exosortase system type 1 associated n=1 Tax=Methylomonas methanica (strain DSM 25384 / MC09) TaxID=857087 RepID=F9ZWG3_METMM|nr:putative O-glycosylation ligase, exosortase A system-associated [Methylomonas methanica]AEF99632.1 wzy family polymerase, exosortase system type 1 associated [Methylomonas methanica MC09]
MRDILITLIVFVGCIYTLKRPYIGVLLWSWLGYMNPHRLAYGFAYGMPFSQVTALVLLVSMIFSKETKRFPINAITIIWIVFVLYMGVTTLFAYFPEDALKYYTRVIKIQLIVFITMMLITDMTKLNSLLWVIVVSIGYYSLKGGVFTLLTGGGNRVWGPENSFIEGNNELAVASLMIIPLMAYLYHISDGIWIKKGLIAGIALSFVGALGSQSRGALLAFAAVVIFFWAKSDRKIIIGLGMTILSMGILAFMPESWYQRMDTIQTYEEDSSAMGRLNAWEYAYNAANHNFFGVGFDSWSPITFALYAPNPLDVHAAHSIYFSVLADHGWLGLLMFLSIFYLSWRKLKVLVNKTVGDPAFLDMNLLARMLQVTLIAYLVGGAFLSLSYYDLPWHILSFVIVLELIYQGKSTAVRTL